jgi:uncharacterized secreted protein with C-terminal beta-propeller domain
MKNAGSLRALVNEMKRSLANTGRHDAQRSEGVARSLALSESIDTSGDAAAPGAMTLSDSTPVSGTVLAEAGVDEGDLVKNDDTFLYLAESPARIRILEMQDAPAGVIERGEVSLGDNDVSSLYLVSENGKRQLAVISQTNSWSYAGWYDIARWSGTSSFSVDLVDVTEATAPQTTWSINIDGTYVDSRRVGNKLYVVSRFYPETGDFVAYPADTAAEARNENVVDNLDATDLLPQHRINGGAEALHVNASRCLLPAGTLADKDYMPFVTSITTVDLENPERMDVSCTVGEDSGLYASQTSLYLFNQGGWDTTAIHKFSMDADGARYEASGRVAGNLGWNNPHLRLSEYDNDLRVVTTRYSEGTECCEPDHALSILRDNNGTLDTVASLPNAQRPAPIGKPGEDLYAVRFQGTRAYAVTFERTDPLYVIDLENPLDPRVAGELEIPGFSDFLQPLGDNLVIGIGHDAVSQGDTTLVQGVKLGVFDVSDIATPRLIAEDIIGKRGSSSAVSYDYHALSLLQFPDTDQYRIVLPVEVHDDTVSFGEGDEAWYDWKASIFRLYTLDVSDASLQTTGDLVVDSKTSADDWMDSGFFRSVIRGNSVHAVYGSSVWSAAWTSPGDATGPQ